MAKAEQDRGRKILQDIYAAFGDDEVGEEELTEFIARINKFYEEANKAMINVKERSLDSIKDVNKLQKAIENIDSVMDENDPLAIIMAFSGDPLSALKPLLEVVNSLDEEIKKANSQIEKKNESIGSDFEEDELTDRYEAELESIKASKAKLERMV